MDLIPQDQRHRTFTERSQELVSKSHPLKITTFATSIWDETLYKAWSSIVYSLIPNVGELEGGLRRFCELSDADEVILFERATLLVISHVTRVDHDDQDRFEKVSNIIKQFKMSCSKSQAQFKRYRLLKVVWKFVRMDFRRSFKA
jgi:Ras-related GTP-binding protein A/B